MVLGIASLICDINQFFFIKCMTGHLLNLQASDFLCTITQNGKQSNWQMFLDTSYFFMDSKSIENLPRATIFVILMPNHMLSGLFLFDCRHLLCVCF